MGKTPAGGPAAIGGIIYQLLCCLLRLTRFELRGVEADADGRLTSAVLVLEPSGGGDLREELGNQSVVTQIKARADEGPWSLQEVITGVFPDLLKAVRLDGPAAAYRLLTEGHIGRWRAVERFFRSLQGRNSGADPLSQLSEAVFVKVGARRPMPGAAASPFWETDEYSERELFQLIVDRLSNGEVGQARSELEQRVWRLLAHFEFCEPLPAADAEAEIDASLSEIVDHPERVADTRRALLMLLAEKARMGNAVIDIGSFLSEAELRALPAGNIQSLVARARAVLGRRLAELRFSRQHHVQEDFTERLASLVVETPIVVVTAESGGGKSWHTCAVAETLAARGALVVHIEAEATARGTLDEAMGVLWNTVKGNTNTLPFGLVARNLRGPPPHRVLVIDRVDEPDVARGLAVAGCESQGLKLVLACGGRAADAALSAAPKSCRVVETPRLSPPELADYFAARQVHAWELVPADVRDTLAHPLLARLYCDTAGTGAWRPTSEYELFHRYWEERLGPSSACDPALDQAALRELGRGLLVGEGYPWRPEQVARALRHEGSLRRLRRSGWLVDRPDGSCVLWHDRLLNWLVAATLAEDVLAGSRTAEEAAQLCVGTARGELRPGGRWLGYVAIDTLWLFAERGVPASASSAILRALESTSTSLYSELIPTLGLRAVPCLIARLDELLAGEPSYRTHEVAACLARIDSQDSIDKARQLLASESSEHRSAALHILGRQDDPDSLDRLWTLHVGALGTPERGVEYQRRMDAIAMALTRQSVWLGQRLASANGSTPGLPDLIFQLARLPNGGTLWRLYKEHLKRVVPADKRRCLLRCILVFRDPEEVEFAAAECDRETDFAGDMALAALSRIDPDAALEALPGSKLRTLTFSRGWHLHPLLASHPDAARGAVRTPLAHDPPTSRGIPGFRLALCADMHLYGSRRAPRRGPVTRRERKQR